MANDEQSGRLELPARKIAPPTTVSAEARRFLSTPRPPFPSRPALDDVAGWREAVAKSNAIFAPIHEVYRQNFVGDLQERKIGNVVTYELVPRSIPERNRNRVLLFLHPGAYVFGGGSLAGTGAIPIASAGGYRTYSPDYRKPPDHPFPAALDDAVAVYQALLENYAPSRIGFVGVSAGGGLAAAAILKARDIGLPLPAAAVLLTPEADLTEAGDTFATNEDLDIVLQKPLMELNRLYAGGADLSDPYLSPVFGEFQQSASVRRICSQAHATCCCRTRSCCIERFGALASRPTSMSGKRCPMAASSVHQKMRSQLPIRCGSWTVILKYEVVDGSQEGFAHERIPQPKFHTGGRIRITAISGVRRRCARAGQDKNLDVRTAFGDVSVHTGESGPDTGLPVYPGAETRARQGRRSGER